MAVYKRPYRPYDQASLSGFHHVNLHRAIFQRRDDLSKLVWEMARSDELVRLNLSQIQLHHSFEYFYRLCKKSDALTKITSANFSANELSGSQCAELVTLLPRVESLNINANALHRNKGLAQLLSKLDGHQTLRTLKLQDNGLTNEDAELLLEHLQKNYLLTTVCLAHNYLDDRYLVRIKNQLWINDLICLQIADLKTADISQPENCLAIIVSSKYLAKYQNAPLVLKNLLAQTIDKCFLKAAQLGDLETLVKLVENGASLTCYYASDKRNALHFAVLADNPAMVEYLAKHCPKLLDKEDANQQLPWHCAKHGSQSAAILEREMRSRLVKMISQANVLAIENILASGINVNKLTMPDGQSVLFRCIDDSRFTSPLALIKGFATAGARLLVRNNHDEDLWQYAQSKGHSSIANYLLQYALDKFRTWVENGRYDIFKFYFKWPVMQQMLDVHGAACLKLAKKYQQSEFVVTIDEHLHRHDVTLMVNSLNVQYQGKLPHKTVLINTEQIHRRLKAEHTERRAKVNIPTKALKTLNLVTAEITFIVSDRPHQAHDEHGRRAITLPLPSERPFCHVGDFYHSKQCQGGPKSAELLDDIIMTSPPSSHQTIQRFFRTPEFHRRYHHAERALYKYLSQPKIITQLVSELHSQIQQEAKAYGVVLHIHSDHSPCEACEKSFAYQYGPYGQWQRKIITELEKQGFKVLTKSGTLASMVTFSFDQDAKNANKAHTNHTMAGSFELNHQHKGKRAVMISQRYSDIAACSSTMFSNFSAKKRGEKGITPSQLSIKRQLNHHFLN